MTIIADVYAVLQHRNVPMTFENIIDAVEEETGRRPSRDQVSSAASQLVRSAAAIRIRQGVYRGTTNRIPLPTTGGATVTPLHPIPVSTINPPNGVPCNLSHQDVLALLFGDFNPSTEQVPLVRELLHAIDGLNTSIESRQAATAPPLATANTGS